MATEDPAFAPLRPAPPDRSRQLPAACCVACLARPRPKDPRRSGLHYNPEDMPSLDFVIPAFNAEACLDGTLDAIDRQILPEGLETGVIVVNDGSTDGTAGIVSRRSGRRIRCLEHARQQGRAAALNTGAAGSDADYVLLLDADCRLVGDRCVQVAAAAMEDGIAAGFGYTTGDASNPLARYMTELEKTRKQKGWQGWTTACCLVRRDVLGVTGGFRADYTHYGFEDRDFICRLRASNVAGELRSLTELRATHDAVQALGDIAAKMYESGRYSSGIFMKRFPEAYADTAYARVDAALASLPLASALRLLAWIERPLTASADRLLRSRRLPAAAGRGLIRLVSAISYFRGTRDRGLPDSASG